MNSNLTKNTDLNYYNIYEDYTNCGSFALRIKEWYEPDISFHCDNDDYATQMIAKGYSYEKILSKLLKRNIEGIKRDFGDEITILNSLEEYVANDDEELIAFRVGYEEYPFNTASTDFHFRVFRDGKWQEKCGTGEVDSSIELEPNYPWDLYNWLYDSDIVFFTHKI